LIKEKKTVQKWTKSKSR